MPKKILVIGGPTASGKTEIAYRLAQKLKTENISADSRQIYRELKIGVARPPDEYLSHVPHHFIASHSIHEPLSAGRFASECRMKIETLLNKYDTLILVGGTGFYIKSVFNRLGDYPLKSVQTREYYNEIRLKQGTEYLLQMLKEKSKLWFDVTDKKNPARIQRALEIVHEYPDAVPDENLPEYDFNAKIYYFLILPPKEKLHQNIRHRVLQMAQSGLKEEAIMLKQYKHLPVLKTVGYREWFENDGKSDEEILGLIEKNTRRYAKRQITWFMNQWTNKFIISHTSVESAVNEIFSVLE
ncbi:MAG: tRNA (adenosine(37)-N6)-dimethylallyltransferase MiaA [Bacteroidia bacterium]|nr:tRNA (adenosine(37)-N6)-dimethylallyltransferase MiaA [Bacteroidia bacterium]